MTGHLRATLRDIAVVAFAQSVAPDPGLSETEMLLPVLTDVLAQAGLAPGEADFTCSGSSDYLAGRPFSFTMTLDGVGAWPPVAESHVEADGAWALYEAWVKLLTGDADTALVYACGKPTAGDLEDVLTRQLDPCYTAPLWPGPAALAGLQAQALADAGTTVPPGPGGTVVDGAAAVVLAAGDRARAMCARPAWIHGIDHRIEPHALGVRDLTRSPSTRLAAERAGAFEAPVDTAELHASHPAQEVILRRELRLTDDVVVTPSGGAPAADPVMATGLIRIGEAADRIRRGESDRALAHATSGPCLQHNLVAVLEGERRP